MKNILGIDITRPTQQLIILRGIPGAGKSTKAKELVNNGIIHSTDSVIESMYNYDEFFSEMKATNNFSKLHQVHMINLVDAFISMKKGVSPVIIDNTNIKACDSKAYVIKALELGFDENNISIVDIGTNGLTAQQLSERNTHNVPLDKIESMIMSYNATGELTINKILDSKDFYTMSNKTKMCATVILINNEGYILGVSRKDNHDDINLPGGKSSIKFG